MVEKAVTLWPSSASYDSVAVTKNEENEEQGEKKEKFQHISSSNNHKETATEHDASPGHVHPPPSIYPLWGHQGRNRHLKADTSSSAPEQLAPTF